MKPAFVLPKLNVITAITKIKLPLALSSGFALAIMAAITSSSKAVIVKLLYVDSTITPLELLFVRLLVALPFFILLLVKGNSKEVTVPSTKSPSKLNWRNILLVCWIGFTGYYFASLTDFIGLTYISASLERIVLFTYPTLLLAIDTLIHRRMPKKSTLLGVLLCYLGLLLVFVTDLNLSANSAGTWRGVGWVMLSGVSFACFYLATNKAVITMNIRYLTGLAGCAAFACSLMHFLIVGDFRYLYQLSLQQWGLIAILGLLCTLLPSLLLASAVKKIGPARTANIGALGPILTIIFASILLGETLSLNQLLGMAIVMLGVHRMK